ncbi:ABC transporter ATP-binding protein/permease [Nocardia sp. NPDC051832]|uniref:ABC transporter ATP-binding protein/permease n=1 Tax=Nocardia sp. NPDC051832 TaxID=3155673 RepID=UPI00343F0C2B
MKTSRDWGIEWIESLKWLVIASSITLVAFFLIAALLLRFTGWGRQFWSVSGKYFVGRNSWRTLVFVALLITLSVAVVRLSVLFTYWSNDLFTSLQGGASAVAGKVKAPDQATADAASAELAIAESAFWDAMILLGVLAGLWIVGQLLTYYAQQAFDIRWRLWLTDHVTSDWLRDRAYYRGRFIDETIDNPDQRIQQDITTFVTQSRFLALGAVEAVVSVVSFTKVLWDLSGPLNVFGIEIPRAMLFIALTYVLLATVIAFWIGRPLIRLNFIYEKATANFRYALVRLRDNAENVAFYQGEGVEKRGLITRFAAVIKAFWGIVYRKLQFLGWNFTVTQSSVAIPYLVQGPRLFAGEITLGGVTQTTAAFREIHDSLSFFRNAYDDFAEYRASLMRLDGLLIASDQSRELPKITMSDAPAAIELDQVDVRKPDGELLIEDLTLRMTPGDALVVKGPSGSGKTTLLRTLGQLWPFMDGEIGRPQGNDTLFLSQIPYLPLGDLRTAVEYPADPDTISDDELRRTLGQVHLAHLADRLDEEADWAKILSPGEQQRLAFARILLIKPKVVFLDEATSAVDEGLEYMLYNLIRTEVPDTMVVSVAHRSTVDQHHTQRLELEGNGPWNLEPVAAEQ